MYIGRVELNFAIETERNRAARAAGLVLRLEIIAARAGGHFVLAAKLGERREVAVGIHEIQLVLHIIVIGDVAGGAISIGIRRAVGFLAARTESGH